MPIYVSSNENNGSTITRIVAISKKSKKHKGQGEAKFENERETGTWPKGLGAMKKDKESSSLVGNDFHKQAPAYKRCHTCSIYTFRLSYRALANNSIKDGLRESHQCPCSSTQRLLTCVFQDSESGK